MEPENNRGKHVETASQRLNEFQIEIDKQIEHWSDQKHFDPYIVAFSYGLKESLTGNPELRTMAEHQLNARKDLDIAPAFNLWLRSACKQLTKQVDKPHGKRRFIHNQPHTSRRFINGFPENGYDRPEKWVHLFNYLSDENQYDHWDFEYDIEHRTLQSLKLQRNVGAISIRNFAMDRLGAHPFVVDMGCSENLGLIQQASAKQARPPYKLLNVTPMDMTLPSGDSAWPLDLAVTARINKLITLAPAIGRGIGIDVVDMREHSNREFAKACSFLPHEWLNWREVEDYELLEASPHPSVDFYQADITNFDVKEFLKYTGGKKPDLITIFTTLNQILEDKRDRVIETMLSMLARDGLIIVQEFGEKNPSSTVGISMDPEGPRKKGLYNQWIIDPHDREPRLIHTATFDNGRANWIHFKDDIRRFPAAQELKIAS